MTAAPSDQWFVTDGEGHRPVDQLPPDLESQVPASPTYRVLWQVDGVWVAQAGLRTRAEAARHAQTVVAKKIYLAAEVPAADGRVVSVSRFCLRHKRERLDNQNDPA